MAKDTPLTKAINSSKSIRSIDLALNSNIQANNSARTYGTLNISKSLIYFTYVHSREKREYKR